MVDLAKMERDLGDVADVVLVHPRVLRQVVKSHRSIQAVGVVPHTRCYAVDKATIRRLRLPEALGNSDRPDVLLVAEPTVEERRRRSALQIQDQVFRAAYHARLHWELERKVRRGELDDRVVQRRVETIGRAEFHEIRAALTHDERLLPPGTDVDVYVEFAASYLELRRFAPELIGATFPGLDDLDAIDAVLSADLDVGELLAAGEPHQAIPLSLRRVTVSASELDDGPRLSRGRVSRLLESAERAANAGRHDRALVYAARAYRGARDDDRTRAERVMQEVSAAFAFRLRHALSGGLLDDGGEPIGWQDRLVALAKRAARSRGLSSSAEAALLRELARAVAEYEDPGYIVDAATWLLSLGRRPAVRRRYATRELEVARRIDSAAERAQNLKLPGTEQAQIARLMKAASIRAEERVRVALRPRFVRTFERVGLTPRSAAERLSRDKLVDELVDRVLERGFLSLPHLRDAVSENQLKLSDVAGANELIKGDPLLRADQSLSVELDGVYRRGDVYLRALQKGSSLPFGTKVGRAIALFVALPAIGAFTILEGARHLANPILSLFDGPALGPPGWIPLATVALVIVVLLHSERARVLAWVVLEALGVLLAWILFRIPRAILTLPAVSRLLSYPIVGATIRRVIVPALLASVVYLLAGVYDAPRWLRVGVPALTLALTSVLFGPRVGFWLEGLFVERIAPTWHVLSRQWLPGFLRLIGRAFSVAMDGLERWIVRVHDVLRFQRTRAAPVVVVAAAAGLLWSSAAYVVRLYVTLLVEPELNPLKHFPVVTVAHKVLLPFLPELLRLIERPFSFFGPFVGGILSGITVFLLPSVFGFLAWELKENYRIYRATRSERIEAARCGPEGETMRGLLVVGVHSGTIPKLFERLRRAAYRRHEMRALGKGSNQESDRDVARFRESMRVLNRALGRFVERDLLARFVESPRWTLGAVRVAQIDMSSNRIRIRLECERYANNACELTFEQLGGMIVSSLPQPGFLAELDETHALLFENALAVFYHRAEVTVVREQLESELGDVSRYDIEEDTLIAWPDESYETELSYKLRKHRRATLSPRVHGRAPDQGAVRTLESARVLYKQQWVTWQSWERAFASAGDATATLPRLIEGPSLLPADAPGVQHRVAG